MNKEKFNEEYNRYLFEIKDINDIKELKKEKIRLKTNISIVLHPLIYLTALVAMIGFFIKLGDEVNTKEEVIIDPKIMIVVSVVVILILLGISWLAAKNNKKIIMKSDIIDVKIEEIKNNKNNIKRYKPKFKIRKR